MCRLRNIAMRNYQESVTTGQTHRQTVAGQSDPYVSLCFAGDTKTRQCFDFGLELKQQLSSTCFLIIDMHLVCRRSLPV